MIQLQKYTPEIYYQQSRDFQFIGRLYDLVLNAAKTNTDLIYNLPLSDDSDKRLVELIALSLGFATKHSYSGAQLAAICSIFPTLLRNKGNIKAIELAERTLLNAEGIILKENIRLCSVENNVVKLFVPQQLTDITLLKDLLTYILPAGMTCEIIRTVSVSITGAKTLLKSTDSVKYIITDETPGSPTQKGIINRLENIKIGNFDSGPFMNNTVENIPKDEKKGKSK